MGVRSYAYRRVDFVEIRRRAARLLRQSSSYSTGSIAIRPAVDRISPVHDFPMCVVTRVRNGRSIDRSIVEKKYLHSEGSSVSFLTLIWLKICLRHCLRRQVGYVCKRFARHLGEERLTDIPMSSTWCHQVIFKDSGFVQRDDAS